MSTTSAIIRHREYEQYEHHFTSLTAFKEAVARSKEPSNYEKKRLQAFVKIAERLVEIGSPSEAIATVNCIPKHLLHVTTNDVDLYNRIQIIRSLQSSNTKRVLRKRRTKTTDV